MVLLKVGVGIAILALIAYAWRKNLKKRKETEELLKIEEEFLASMAHEREGRIFTMADVEKDLPQDAEEDWEPMMMQPEEHKCNCGHCHHEEENHECHCGEEGHECQCEECHCHQENQEEEIEIKEEEVLPEEETTDIFNEYYNDAAMLMKNMTLEEKINVVEQVKNGIDQLRPYLQADGGDVEFVEMTDEGVVYVKLKMKLKS